MYDALNKNPCSYLEICNSQTIAGRIKVTALAQNTPEIVIGIIMKTNLV